MAQFPVLRPFAEPDLADEPGLHPVHPGPGQPGATLEGGIRALVGGQHRVQAGQRALLEAGTDPSRVGELAVAVVRGGQQVAEPGTRALWVGVAADCDLLAALALELQPVPAAASPVWS